MAIPGNFLSAVTESVDPNTSGWVAKLNCSISKGTGGRNGDGTLRLSSTAAGEMQARTVASYPVTPWTEYQTLADASGATVPERIGLRWLDSTGTEISISWSLTTATASATWHRISVADFAPGTAASVQVVVSATPAAGSVINHFENVYLGLPQRTTGNMIAFNPETLERDTSGWVVETNCTLSRQVPMVQWPVNYYAGGGHVMAMTVTANGNASAKTVDSVAATPGVEYLAYALINPPTAGSTCWVEIRFLDAANSVLQTARANLAAPGTGYYRQRVADTAPANTTQMVIAVGITGATAAQVARFDGIVVYPSSMTPVREGSLVKWPDATFEQGVGSWTVASGAATLARITPWGTDFVENAYCLVVTSATATTSVIRTGKIPIGDAAGLSFTTEYAMKVVSGGWTLTRSIRWYDAANVDLGITSGAAAAVPTPNWWLLSIQHTAPAGATQAAVEWTLTATAAPSVLRVDKVSLWESVPLVEAIPNDAEAYVTVTMRELPLGDTISVWRVAEDGSQTLVRGTSGLINAETIASDVLVFEDYEAPLGSPFVYYGETRDSSNGISGTRVSVSITLDPGDTNYGWLKDPGQPQRNTRVMIARAPDWQRPIAQAEHRVKGRKNSVVHSDVRGGLEGDLVVYTQSDDERKRLDWLLDSGNVLLWQVAPGMGEDDVYVNVGQVVRPRTGGVASDPWRTWTLPLKVTDMPTTVGLAGSAGRTWQDVLTEFATWADVLATYATWEDVLLDRRIT
ncbi:hypothetical protein ACFUJR_14710 [Streptomyces sp. NPDC057271]|uniref:hypothetical protein n=1 Tax=unclassified Streptomyces TaxID=2593676 RepID=UPI00362F2BA3